MGEWRYGSTRSAFSRWLEQSAQLHGPSALLAGKTLSVPIVGGGETAMAQWLRYSATNRKVAGSIPAGVSRFFIDIKNFRLPWVRPSL